MTTDLSSGKVLAGKVALITGGGSGIGRASALLFAQAGAAVAVVDLNQKSGQDVVKEIADHGGKAVFERADVTRADDCERAVRRTVSELGGIHVLFNNAGIIRRASVIELSEEDWDRVMAVNVKSMFLMSRLAISIMSQSGGGAIINMASGLGIDWRSARRGLLCFEGRSSAAHQGDGSGSWATEYPGELHLPGRYRHPHAAAGS
jgi:NAD(P)-dependent dehydrogenase (short-subunit alcohol dehydrogenase family)